MIAVIARMSPDGAGLSKEEHFANLSNSGLTEQDKFDTAGGLWRCGR
jgi:hypothetical protein